jgi:hypothetical protein
MAKKYYPKQSGGVEIFFKAACYTLAGMFLWNKGSD